MTVIECIRCGGKLEVSPDMSVGTCQYCGAVVTIPKSAEKKANLFNRANYLRRSNEFDKAAQLYENILQEDNNEAEAHWGLVLCKYGIEYVEDPKTHERIPTCHRTSYDSVLIDPEYKQALTTAIGNNASVYETQAKEIDRLQKAILALSAKEEPFDIFLCYKETDEAGQRTEDSVIAQEVYFYLEKQGFKVFFARKTLEGKLGKNYEPVIFAALNSAKVMVVLGTKPEHFNAVWVKNEWSRFFELVKKDHNKAIIPAYKKMTPYDLPQEFSSLQALDMGKIGFIQDLCDGARKIINASKKTKEATAKNASAYLQGTANINTLLERAFICLEDGEQTKADGLLEQVLNLEPKSAKAYIGKLMVELKLRHKSDLALHATPLTEYNSFVRASGFADENYKKVLQGYNQAIIDRIETERKERSYQTAVNQKNAGDYINATQAFTEMGGYKASQNQAEECRSLAEQARIKAEQARIEAERRAEQQRIEAERKKLEDERQSELRRILAEKRKKKIAKTLKVAVPSAVLAIVFLIVLNAVIIPANKYGKAMDLLADKQYGQAAEKFAALGNYKDSREQLVKSAIPGIKQAKVGDLVNYGRYEQDNNSANGKEAIAWKVLAVESDKVLLIAEQCLDCKPYNEIRMNITWEGCTLRTWLNEEFINTAFSKAEQALIAQTEVINSDNPISGTAGGNDTIDKTFLLSIDEVKKYFVSYGRQAKATSYTIAQGAFEKGGMGNWWLRSPGDDPDYAGFVDRDGYVYFYYNVSNPYVGVRPALWLNLSS